MLVSIVCGKLFDDGEEHIFVVTAAVSVDIVSQGGAKRFLVLFFNGLESPLEYLLETKVFGRAYRTSEVKIIARWSASSSVPRPLRALWALRAK